MPASVGQRLCWLLERFRGAGGATNCPIVLRLRGDLDEERLAAGLRALAARHESLRTTFEGRGRRLAQVVHAAPRDPFDRVERLESDVALRGAVLEEIRRPIDATEWPTRTTLWRLAGDDHVLCLNTHHLVTDGWSCSLALRDLDALTRREQRPLPPVGWQYRRFSAWQAEWLESSEAAATAAYWRAQLAGARAPSIPFGAAPAGAPREDGVATATIEPGVVEHLQQAARTFRTTLPAVMLAAYYSVLARATGDRDLAVASFLSNRTRPEVRETVGLLANMVVLRARLGSGAPFAEVVRTAHETVMGAFVHQRLPYQLLPADTFAAGRRADDVMFQMVPDQMAEHSVAGAQACPILVDELGTRFECELQVYPRQGAMHVVLFFNRSRLDPCWAASLVEEFAALAAGVAGGEAVAVGR